MGKTKLNTNQLNISGTGTSSTFLRGDNAWVGIETLTNSNIHVVNELSDIIGDQSGNANKIWEIRGTIDLGGGVIDLSSYNITFKDGGGLLTNFTSINLGDFKTDGNPNAVYFDQSGTISGECIDEIVYIRWFGSHENGNLVSGGTLNGALPDHVAIQNAMAVLPLDGGTLSFPSDAWLMQGDGTNPDYTYVNDPYIGAGNVSPDSQDDEIGVLQGFVFNNYDNLTILGNGVTILAHPDQTCIVNNKGFEFIACDNLLIQDITYNGNLVQRDPYLIDLNPYNVQHSFGFYGCKEPILKRIIATDGVMDGFYMGANSGGVGAGYGGTMYDCKSLYNYRQGLSAVSHSAMKVYNSKFSFTGQRLSTVGTADGRYLTTSPSAGIDMEAGGTSTAPSLRGQYDWVFDGCRFETNYGAGLAVHWGSTRTMVVNCVFVDDSLFEPQDSVEETTGNNTYMYNSFINSTVNLEAGGQHFIGNTFYRDDISYTYGLFPPEVANYAPTELQILDPDNHYSLGYTRQTIVKNNLIKVELTSANFPVLGDPEWVGLVMGNVIVQVKDAIVKGNTIINAIGNQSGGTDNTMANIGTSSNKYASNVDGNTWSMTSAALAKYTGNVGRMNVGINNESFNKNFVYSGYTTLSGVNLQSSNTGVELRGSYAKFSSLGGQVDGDEAYEIYLPNTNGDVKITTVGGTGLGNSIQETWFSTYDTTYRRSGYVHGAIDSSWYFTNPATATNPKTSATGYRIVAAHDVVGNVNYETQIIVEWFGQNGTSYNEEEFLVFRNTSEKPAGTYRRVYDGGLRGTTANIPTTGGVGNYTEINIGADYYNTDTKTMLRWGGSGFTGDTMTTTSFTPYLTLGSTNGQAVVEELKDELDAAILGTGTGAVPIENTFGSGETSWNTGVEITDSHQLTYGDGTGTLTLLHRNIDYTWSGTTFDFTGSPILPILSGDVMVMYPNVAVPTTYTAAETSIADAGGLITATDVEGALQENRTAIDLNTAKVTNATHTGDVTGSTVLTIDPTSISGKTSKPTLTGTEELSILDAGTIKKTTAQAIADLGGGATTSEITNISEYSTAASLPAVTGTETDTYAMVLFDSDANNGLYAIINGVWKLLVHEDDINWSSVIRPSINEINLRGNIVNSTTTATEEGVIVGYKFNIKDTGAGTLTLATDATYYITDFIPIKPKGAVVIGSTANTYWLFDKDKQPLDDADVDYNNRTYGYTTLSGDDEVAYIRWSLPISTIGNGSMAAQLYNVYENNPALQVTTGWEDYHGKAMGKVQISAGTSGSIDGILANGVQIMSGSVSYLTSRANTASLAASNINAYTSSPNYTATAVGEYILIWTTDTDGSTANTYTIVSSATTLTTVDTNMSGGLSEPYKRDNTKYVFEDNGIVWVKPTNNLYDYRFGEYPRNYQATGVVSTSNGSSGFIPCKGLRPYTLSTGANTQISFYTADKVFISGTTDWDGFVTPTTARYFTLQMSRALNFKSINVTQSTYTQPTTYKETGEELISSNYPVNKSLCLIGDSIGTESTTYASISSYASRLAIALGFNDFVNLSVSGKSLNQFAADINSGRQTAPVSDIYIIALGTNDHAFNRPLGSLGDTAVTDTFFGDIQELVEAIQTLNPNAEIAFITNGRRGTSAATTEFNATTSLWLQQFAGAIESYSLQNNYEYVNLYEKSLANPQRSVINTNYYVSADATHLNNDGHNVFYFPLVATMMKKLAK